MRGAVHFCVKRGACAALARPQVREAMRSTMSAEAEAGAEAEAREQEGAARVGVGAV